MIQNVISPFGPFSPNSSHLASTNMKWWYVMMNWCQMWLQSVCNISYLENTFESYCHWELVTLHLFFINLIWPLIPELGLFYGLCKADPPENWHLTVKKLPKTWHFFQKNWQKFSFFSKKLPLAIFWQSNGNFPEGQVRSHAGWYFEEWNVYNICYSC